MRLRTFHVANVSSCLSCFTLCQLCSLKTPKIHFLTSFLCPCPQKWFCQRNAQWRQMEGLPAGRGKVYDWRIWRIWPEALVFSWTLLVFPHTCPNLLCFVSLKLFWFTVLNVKVFVCRCQYKPHVYRNKCYDVKLKRLWVCALTPAGSSVGLKFGCGRGAWGQRLFSGLVYTFVRQREQSWTLLVNNERCKEAPRSQ